MSHKLIDLSRIEVKSKLNKIEVLYCTSENFKVGQVEYRKPSQEDTSLAFMWYYSQALTKVYGSRRKVLNQKLEDAILYFISQYNKTILAIQSSKDDGSFGKYRVAFLPKRDGTKRKLYIPEPGFSKALRQFAKFIELVIFDRYSSANRFGKKLPKKARGRAEGTSFIQIIPTHVDVSKVINTICKRLSGAAELHKMDIKNAYESTSSNMVSSAIINKLSYGGTGLYFSFYISFILNNLDMCFVDGKLPTGFPTSPALFEVVKQHLFAAFKKSKHLNNYYRDLCYIASYADDIYLIVNNSFQSDKVLQSFMKVLRIFNYRINKNKYKKFTLSITKDLEKLSSTKILGKNITITRPNPSEQTLECTPRASRSVKNKLRMLEYIKQKESTKSIQSSSSTLDTFSTICNKINCFKNFYDNSLHPYSSIN